MRAGLWLAALSLAICQAQDNLDSVIERVRKEFDVPGIAVAVVKDGRVVVSKGYGVRKLGESAPVTAKTLFGIASNTKAMTAAALAVLVDEGKIRWDDQVVKHLPTFQMSDAYVTREMTVRDLLVHRSGLALGAGDLMFFPSSDLTSDEIYKRLRYVPLGAGFRSRYAYDNILYLAAGKVIEAVSGKTWAAFVRERIFAPLGMDATKTGVRELKPGDEYAMPHAPADGKLVPVSLSDLDNNAPAGAVQSSVEDMAKWVTLQLNRGELGGGKRLFSAAQSREMWSPVTIIPVGEATGPLAALQPNFQAYALGWVVSDYRGRKMVHHTGGLAGMVSKVALVPDLKLGVIVLTNQEAGAAFQAISWTVVDHYVGAPATDWVGAYLESTRKREAEAQADVKKAAEKRNAASKPSLALSGYAGRYRDPWYGDVIVEEKAGKLEMRFTHSRDLAGELEHFQYDTFIARWKDRSLLADAYATFVLSAEGTVEQVKMKAVSPLTDFSYDFHHLVLKPVDAKAPAYD